MDNYTLALEKDRDTRIAELERCRSEVERFVAELNRSESVLTYWEAKTKDVEAEVERLTRERDDQARVKQVYQDAERMALMSAEAWKVRAEKAERERDEAQRALLFEQQVREAHRSEAEYLRSRLEGVENDRAEWQRVGSEWKARSERAEEELLRVQGLPELEWAQTAAIIVQGLALHARTAQPAAKQMLEALDKAKTYVGRLKARAEAAEAQLAEAGKNVAEWANRLSEAEADNAALLESFTTFVACIGKRSTEIGPTEEFEAWLEARDAITKPHPGAALLERLRAAEGVVEAARVEVTMSAPLEQALAAYDAAREGK